MRKLRCSRSSKDTENKWPPNCLAAPQLRDGIQGGYFSLGYDTCFMLHFKSPTIQNPVAPFAPHLLMLGKGAWLDCWYPLSLLQQQSELRNGLPAP